MVHLSETERIELLVLIGYGGNREQTKFCSSSNTFLSPRFQKPYEDLMKLEVLKNVQNLAGQKLLQMMKMPLMSS